MRFFGTLLFAIMLIVNAGAWGQSKTEKNFKKLSAEILENLQEYWPVHATDMGIHAYDSRFTDYSPKAVTREKRKLRDFLAHLRKYDRSRLPLDTRIDQKLLIGNCETAVLKLWGIRYQDKNPNLYIGDAVDGLYFILIRDYTPMAQRLDNIIGRMNALPAFLKQGKKNLKEIPPVWLEYAKDNIDNAITFYETVETETAEEFPQRGGEIHTAAKKARAALNDFKQFLLTAAPGPAGSFAIGREYFNHMLKSEHMLKFNADSLLKIGEQAVIETKAEYERMKQKLHEEGKDFTLPYFVPEHINKEDVLNYYAWEIKTVKEFLQTHDLITITPGIGECKPVETPKFLRGVISGIAYQPAGPFDNATTGYFYVSPIPDSMTDEERKQYYGTIHNRNFRGSVVHEAFPGHHLQLQTAGKLTSDVRKWQMNNSFVEGWALYCEQMMYEQGLYPDQPARYLGVLRGVLFRAARIVVDVKLQTGQFSYQQAVDYMMETLSLSDNARGFIETEVRRYTMDPTQPMSYLIGKLAILDLKKSLQQKEGDAFSLKSFHDRLLAEGSIPVSLIRKKLLR